MRLALPPALFACLVLAGPVCAQDADPVYDPAIAAHRDGRWSMQFEIGQDFQLQSFEGAGLAVTKNSSHSKAWRFGVNVSGDMLDDSQTRTTTTDSSFFETTIPSQSEDRAAIAFDILRLLRYQSDRRIGMQLGFGPTIRLSRFDRHFDDPGSAFEFEARNSNSSYGLLGRLGVEVFVARAVSLHAHYGAFAGYVQQTETTHVSGPTPAGFRTEVVERQQRDWLLSTQGVTMGISVYL
jgi:hypothetical protein